MTRKRKRRRNKRIKTVKRREKRKLKKKKIPNSMFVKKRQNQNEKIQKQ